MVSFYDAASNLQSEVVNGTTSAYSYDFLNQLTVNGPQTWTYDATGNRTNTGYATGTGNRLTNDGTWTYSYDNEGNLQKKTKGVSAETWTYGYDYLNHLTWVEQRSTDGGTLLLRDDFKYDVFGNRIEKDVNTGSTVVTRFAFDGSNVWADLSSTNALLVRYVGGDQVDQHVARIVISGPNPGVAWYLTDHLGSIRNLTDSTGTIQDAVVYDASGIVTSESNAAFGDRYKFTGRELDGETGLQLNGWRYYDARVSRWLSEDPLGFGARDANLYRYAGNRPTNATDPSGLDAVAPTGRFTGAIVLPGTIKPIEVARDQYGGAVDIHGNHYVLVTRSDFPAKTKLKVSTIAELKRALQRLIKSHVRVKVLEIEGHGNWKYLSFNSKSKERINENTAAEIGGLLKDLNWARDARIYLSACNTGGLKIGKPFVVETRFGDVQMGHFYTWPQIIARKSGIPVWCPLGFCSGTVVRNDISVARLSDGVALAETSERYGSAADTWKVFNPEGPPKIVKIGDLSAISALTSKWFSR